jgi:streptogramin lyase
MSRRHPGRTLPGSFSLPNGVTLRRQPTHGPAPGWYRIVRVDPKTKQLAAFVSNRQPGPASMQGKVGEGLERPFDIKFGPDGAMYIVDYGVVKINPLRQGREPYEYVPNTGVIWKVSKSAVSRK